MSPRDWVHDNFRDAKGEPIELDPWQEQVLVSSKDMILNCSRQCGKSFSGSLLAAWTAIYRPKSLTLLISPTQRQAQELFRTTIEHLEVMGERQSFEEDNALSCTLVNKSRIKAIPATEAVRGFSPSLVLADECSRYPDAIFSAITPLMAASKGRIIYMSTPYGKRGQFFELWNNGDLSYERIEVPAAACKRITQEFLERERVNMPPWQFSQEYGCIFGNLVESMFDSSLLEAVIDYSIQPLFPVAKPNLLEGRK